MSGRMKKQKTKSKSETQYCKSLNPCGKVSLILPDPSGAPKRERGGCLLLSTPTRQVALATRSRNIGGKLRIFTLCMFQALKVSNSQCRV